MAGKFDGNKMEPMTQTNVKGYRQLTEDEVKLMNEAKEIAEQCSAYIAKLRALGEILDQRWVSIGATDLRLGFMAVFRGIEQPTFDVRNIANELLPGFGRI